MDSFDIHVNTEQGSSSRRTRTRVRRTTAAPAPSADETTRLPLVREPAGGTPDLVSTVQGVLEWCARVREGEALALDVERASSFRYSARAYLVQVKTESAGILLLDPLAFRLPETLHRIFDTHPWVLHASRQDLPSLHMLSLTPPSLFDTEVAARLLGMPRVGLGALTEELLGVRLAKEHSAANWSKRPLPGSWLDYAALDVEYLVPLTQILTAKLREAGKYEWALEEFAFESTFSEPDPAMEAEPWRSLHGIGTLRHPKQLAVARALWEHRDEIARSHDIAPFMVVRDKYLIAMAKATAKGRAEFNTTLPKNLKHREQWWRTAREAHALPAAHLPSSLASNEIPHHKQWGRKHPEALAAYTRLREGLLAHAEHLHMPVENLISPGHARRYVWGILGPNTPAGGRPLGDQAEVEAALRESGARPWQAAQVAPIVLQALPQRSE